MRKTFHRISTSLALAWLCGACLAVAQEEGASAPAAAAAFDPPQAPQPDRYRRLWEQSPFTARPVETPTELPPNFIEDLKLIGLFDMAGRGNAILQRISTEEYITVREGETAGPISLVSVIGEGDLLRRRVELRAGNETASLGFDSASMIPEPGPGAVRAAPASQQGGDQAGADGGGRGRDRADRRGGTDRREEAIARARAARDARQSASGATGQGGGARGGRPQGAPAAGGGQGREGQPNVVPRRRVVLPQ